MQFPSDNWSGVHPKIMDAILAANQGSVPAYGGDDLTERARQLFCDIFERDCAVFFVATGSAANGLALSQIVPPYGGILCSDVSHINIDEPGTVEFFTGGARLIPIASEAGKITPDQIHAEMRFYNPPEQRRVKASALSVTQGTESGTVYSISELGDLCEAAKSRGLKVHMDGARFANAMVHLGRSPADATWKAGVDVLCFGATKNGAMAAEAVVFFNPQQAEEFGSRLSRAGQVFSKNRFIAAQWVALLTDNLWLDMATQANAAATSLAAGIASMKGCEVVWPTQINEVFANLPDGVAEQMRQEGARFHDWLYPGDKWNGNLQRMVTNFSTSDEEVDALLRKLELLLVQLEL